MTQCQACKLYFLLVRVNVTRCTNTHDTARCPRWCGSQAGASISARVPRARRAERSGAECDALFCVRRSQNLQDGRKSINPACIACGADRNTTDTLTRVLGTSLVWGVLRVPPNFAIKLGEIAIVGRTQIPPNASVVCSHMARRRRFRQSLTCA